MKCEIRAPTMAQVSKYNHAPLRWASRVTKVIVKDIQLQSVWRGGRGHTGGGGKSSFWEAESSRATILPSSSGADKREYSGLILSGLRFSGSLAASHCKSVRLHEDKKTGFRTAYYLYL